MQRKWKNAIAAALWSTKIRCNNEIKLLASISNEHAIIKFIRSKVSNRFMLEKSMRSTLLHAMVDSRMHFTLGEEILPNICKTLSK